MIDVRIQIALVLCSMTKLEIIQTDDGSPSLWNPDLDETYHSRFGALQEARHVFIEAGFNAVSQVKREFSILEVGLGTGLNAALVAAVSHSSKISYVGLEPFPIDEDLLCKMNFEGVLSADEFDFLRKIWQAPFGEKTVINHHFQIEKSQEGMMKYDNGSTHFSLIFFDAFAPKVQDELWRLEVFERVYQMTALGGVLVTYCAKGQVRRDLIQAGFEVEKLEGPAGKRHMLRATKR